MRNQSQHHRTDGEPDMAVASGTAMDPRIARTHQAVMDAAIELLLEGGPGAVTVDGVVARSGIAKTTIYRHWATRDALVADVFEHLAPDIPAPDPTLPFEEALRELAHSFVDVMSDPYWKRLLPSLMLLKSQQSAIADLETDLKKHQSDVVTPVFACGVREGALGAEEDPEICILLLVGPILMAGRFDTVPLTHEFADKVTDHFLAATRTAV